MFKSLSRRSFLKSSALTLAAANSLLPYGAAYASGAPEVTGLKLGFIALTDSSPLIVAKEKGLFDKFGLTGVEVMKQASWGATRDNLVLGADGNGIDGAHILTPMAYGLTTGAITADKQPVPMKLLARLNVDGQAISISKAFADLKVGLDASPLKAAFAKKKTEGAMAKIAVTFPGGTHDLWMRYWLAAGGIDPNSDVEMIVVPPPQMVANMRIGNMDGYCVGEPWNARAIYDKVGYTVATSQDIWPDHPEKVLGTTAEFVAKNPNTARALIMAVLEASKYIEATENRAKVAELISQKSYVNAPKEVILGRFLGEYDNGNGRKWKDANFMKFFEDGKVPFPYLSDGMWFLTQHKRWGMLKSDPDYLAVAKKVNRIDIYTQAASALGISVPPNPMRISKLMDGTVWDGKDPKAYAASFKIKA